MGSMGIQDMAQMVAPGCDTMETGMRSTEKLHEDLVHPYESAVELDAGYYLGRDLPGGITYTSEIAPRITREQFLAMLREVEL